jgi:hypothetical protein
LITRTFDEEYGSWSSSLWSLLQSRITSSFTEILYHHSTQISMYPLFIYLAIYIRSSDRNLPEMLA